MLKQLKETVDLLKTRIPSPPEIGIVLGTGLGGLTGEMNVRERIPYAQIPHFPVSTVEGHEGELISGTFEGRNVLALKGRFHYYEGYSLQQITFPVRVMRQLGIELLILSNASGGLNPDFQVGDIMFIEDHINLMHDSPLRGLNHPELGPRFPDMSEPYDLKLIEKATQIAREYDIRYAVGVYAGVTGPTFETPAEYRYIRTIGADAVGMSTVPEVIVANHMSLPVFAVSVISDLGVEGKIVKISHQEVIDAASHAEPGMTRVIKELVRK